MFESVVLSLLPLRSEYYMESLSTTYSDEIQMPPEPRVNRTEVDRIHDAIEELGTNIQQVKLDVAKILATCSGCQHRIESLEDGAQLAAANEKISVRSVGWLIGIIGTLIGTIGGAIAMAIGRTSTPNIP